MKQLWNHLGVVALAALAAGFSTQASALELAVPCADAQAQGASVDADQDAWRYPYAARKQRAEGTVKLRVQLDNRGQVSLAQLAESSGSVALDRAALKAARTERFCEFKSPEQPMSGLAEVSVTYSLNVAVARL